jgi:uncharacterized protein
MKFGQLFPEKPIIGMIHMPPASRCPEQQAVHETIDRVRLSEADKLEGAGLDACIVENVGDTPLFKENLPPYTIAAMATVTKAVVEHAKMKVGVNILRNACDGLIIGEPDFKVDGVWGGPSDGKAYERAVRTCRP